MLLLYRYNQTDKLTQGLLLFHGKFLADTLEPPWKNNVPFLSSIPEGIYPLHWVTESHEWPCYEVQNVPGRNAILIHPLNTATDTQGCIGVGQKWGEGLWHSAVTLGKVHEVIQAIATLTITSKFGL